MPKKGKSKDKKKKKKGKKGDGSNIAAAIMPTAVMAAVPRSPPPTLPQPHDSGFGPGLSSGVLSSSLLGRMFATAEQSQRDGFQTDETDTSLYDYERGREMHDYAEVYYGNGEMPPPREFRDDEYPDTDDMAPEIDVMVHQESGEPLYSSVRKPGRARRADFSSDDELSPRPGPSSRHGGSLRSSGRSRHSDTVIEERIEAQMVERHLRSAPPNTSLKRPPSEVNDLEALEQEIIQEYEQEQQGDPDLEDAALDHEDRVETVPLHKEHPQTSDTPLQPPARRKRSRSKNRDGGDNVDAEIQEEIPIEHTQQKPRKKTKEGATLLELLTTSRAATGRESDSEEEVIVVEYEEQAEPERMLGQPPYSHHQQRVVKRPPMGNSGASENRRPSTPDLSDNLSRTASPKLQSLKEQNVQLLQQQLQIQQQLQDQQQLQQQLMQKLQQQGMLASQQPDQTSTMEMGSLLQETQSVTDVTLQKQSQLIQSHQTRASVLEQENQELQELNDRLQFEIDSLHRMASFRDDDEMAATQTSLLKKQLQDYKEEVGALKNGIQRVNVELSRFQAKYRPFTAAEREEMPGLPIRGPKPPWLVNTKYLSPLLVAYDDRMKEKDDTIKQYEREIDDFRLRIEEIIKENQRLHLRIEQSDISGPISMTEWRQLQEQCKLVLEENQLLMEQLDVQQNKGKDMMKAHVQEVSKLSKRLVGAEADREQLQRQVTDLRENYGEMKKEHDSVVIENKSKLGVEVHLTTVNELKSNLEAERAKLAKEMEEITYQMQSITSEKRGLELEVFGLKEENSQMKAEVKALNKALRKSHKKAIILQTALEEIETKEQTAEHYLTSMVKMAEQTAMERDTFAEAAHNQNRQKAAAMNKLMKGSVSIGMMEEKLKMYKLKASEKLQKAAHRMKEQDNDFNMQRQEYEREIKHLRLLLREKEEVFHSLAGEKKQIENDLETMWQVASSDNRRMKDTLRKNLRKLQEHTSMKDIMSDIDGDRDELLPLSDTEKA